MGVLEQGEQDGERGRTARIIIVGSELLRGIVRDENLYYISSELTSLGFHVDRALILHDKLEDIVNELLQAIKAVDVVIVTGGLGPTQDDITRYAVSQAFKLPLIVSHETVEKLRSIFNDEKEVEKRMKMCYIPKNALILENKIGVAPGFYLKIDSSHIFVLPGVPREVKEMFASQVLPILRSLYNLEKVEYVKIKFFNIREKNLEDVILKLLEEYGIKLYYKILIKTDHLELNIAIDNVLAPKIKDIVHSIVREVKYRYPKAEYVFDFGAGGGI